MALVAGTKLGPYEIVGPIGAGGMGQVYRGRDTRLDRSVAIKVLPPHLADDPELRRRFEREARVISSLSHPHICTLFDVGQQDGTDYLVMELLEGETLAHRLARGPMPVEQVLKTGIEIADALEKAHKQGAGVVHRDLKPANIMLTKSGAKLLDFGLAKYTQAPAQQAAMSGLATEESKLTDKGEIVGTFQYMAPEQLEGKEADTRTDIFALGSVLYEMTTGRPAFVGKTRASLIGNIMNAEPAATATLQPLSPPALDRVIKTCMAKDPDERWQTAHDVKLELKWVLEGGSGAGLPAPVVARRKLRERAAWTLVGLMAVASAALTLAYLKRAPKPAQRLQFAVMPAPGTKLDEFSRLGVSPDGTKISWVASEHDTTAIWVRSLDSAEPRRLEGTEGAGNDFWLPDGENIGFDANDRFQKVNVASGVVESLCKSDKFAFGLTWNKTGDVLFTVNPTGQDTIHLINVSSCQVRDVVKPDVSKYDQGYAWAHFLPDGRHFFYSGLRSDKRHDVLIGSLDTGQSKLVIHNGSDARYTEPGLVLFEREGQLMSQPFDLRKLEATGVAAPVVNRQLIFGGIGGIAMYDVSVNGVLVYREQDVPPFEITWRDLAGRVLERLPEPGFFFGDYLSRDGTKLAGTLFDMRNHTGDVQLLDLRTKAKSRLTNDHAPGGVFPALSPDGTLVLYTTDSLRYLKVKALSSDAEPRTIVTSQPGEQVQSLDWSPDGKQILYGVFTKEGRSRIYLVPAQGGSPKLLTGSAFDDTGARFSPDGRWITYASDETGQTGVYVRGVADGSGKWQISDAGGTNARWGADGKTVFFISAQNQLSSAAFNPTTSSTSKPRPLFEVLPHALFDVERDGRRILLTSPVRGIDPPITVMLNWNQ
jgi:Tol biopolymer transport system component